MKITVAFLVLVLARISLFATGDTVTSDNANATTVAKYQLGLKYLKGDGVPKNVAEALVRFYDAASEGNADAEYAIGMIFAHGEGVPRDFVEGLARVNIAAANGNADYFKERDQMEVKLGNEGTLLAQQRSRLILNSYVYHVN